MLIVGLVWLVLVGWLAGAGTRAATKADRQQGNLFCAHLILRERESFKSERNAQNAQAMTWQHNKSTSHSKFTTNSRLDGIKSNNNKEEEEEEALTLKGDLCKFLNLSAFTRFAAAVERKVHAALGFFRFGRAHQQHKKLWLLRWPSLMAGWLLEPK